MSTTLAIQLVAAHRGLISAHQHAERFHYAMGEALEAADEIDAANAEHETPDPHWIEKHECMLGIAAAELQAMPATWAAILTASVEQPK